MANTSESPNFIAKHVEQSRVIADLQHQLAADGLEASWNTAVAAAVAALEAKEAAVEVKEVEGTEQTAPFSGNYSLFESFYTGRKGRLLP